MIGRERLRDVEYTVEIPQPGFVGYLQVEGRTADASIGGMERALIDPPNVAGDYIHFATLTLNQADGSVKIEGWTTDRALSVAYAYNVGPADTVTPPTEAQAEARGGGATGGGLITGFTSDFVITLPAGTVDFGEVIKVLLIAYINANGTGPDGNAQDHDIPVGVMGERFKITDPDQIELETILERHFSDEAVSNRALALNAVARANIIDREINAAKIALLGLDETGIFANLVIEGRVIVDDAIIARHLLVGTLSEISDDVGIVVSGELRNAAGTRYINLDATGANPWINSEKFYITANGNAYFAGELVAATGTFAGTVAAALFTAPTATFEGSVEVVDLDVSGVPAVLSQQSLTLSDGVSPIVIEALINVVSELRFSNALLYRFDAPIYADFGGTVKLIEQDAADSGGTGFRRLRVVN